MKKLLIIILFIATGCKEKLSENYRGYVFNLKKEPLSNVKVYERRDSTKYVYTKKNGYFLLKPRSLTFVDDLIFIKEGYVTDSLETVYYNRGQGTISLFLRQRSDTLFMKEIKQITLPNKELS
ncbi:hypothetical protein [Tenacibaculum finnmarkense]|uniref:hypothetical protein n=1 Tax=Tenacibaculum finnmarkense TaxID=2781243 RepID=UPI000C3D8018|nr:hypothetical protein [Tenacibaculum finnmarkense]MCD8440849.1 hypothetical protein [Tenacibaculum finnmarkense genomovar ulcerans]MCG8721762.1 hypothetical protein [Tenacibaculum finnmarkense]SOS56023.1 conserved hypothetical protein [Tenacibaculum finnmarkense]